MRRWGTDYDWRKAEAKLNAYPQFKMRIDGVDAHFIHVRSRQPNALPLIITHGWPGSVLSVTADPCQNPRTLRGLVEDTLFLGDAGDGSRVQDLALSFQ